MCPHPFVHIELSSLDREASGKFYHELFGWEVTQLPDMNYATFATAEGSPGGGFNPITPDAPSGTILPYVYTEDIKASLEKVVKLGGQVLTQPAPIKGVGLFALFKDPSGNKLALLEMFEEEK